MGCSLPGGLLEGEVDPTLKVLDGHESRPSAYDS